MTDTTPATSKPPTTLKSFLATIRLEQYESTMLALGFDDVEDYKNMEATTTRPRGEVMPQVAGENATSGTRGGR